MATIDEHMKDCKKFIGKSYEDVHKFLDQYADIFSISVFYDYHRSFLHNSFGLAVAESRWGHKGLLAAQIHLVRDYMEGPLLNYEDVRKNLPRAIMHFNNLNNFELNINPKIIAGWKDKSLVSIAIQ